MEMIRAPTFRVIHRSPHGTSSVAFHDRESASAYFSLAVVKDPTTFHVTLWERRGDWRLCNQFHDPRVRS